MRITLLYLIVLFLPICSLAQGYDSCRTYLYNQQIGNNSSQQKIARTKTVQDHGMISVGFTADINGNNKDALLFKQDKSGRLLWQQRVGTPAFDEQFTSFRETYYKEIITSGIATNTTTQQRLMQITKLTKDGNIIWQKNFNSSSASTNINNSRIAVGEKKNYFFAAQTDSSIIYGMIDPNGNLLWQRSFSTSASTELVDISSEADNLLILTNSMDSGYHVVKQYYINYYWFGSKDIKYTRKYGGLSQQANYILNDMEIHGGFSYFSGIRSVAGQPYQLIRLNINQGYIPEGLETITTPGVVFDSTGRSAISGYGECIAFTDKNKSKNVNLIKLSGSYNYPINIYWSEKTIWQDSVILKGCTKTWDAGYMIYGASEKPGRKNVLQLKTDSAGITPFCTTRTVAGFSIDRVTFPSDTVQYLQLPDMVLPASIITAQSSMLLDTIVFCRELKCPPHLPYDTCSPSFHKVYTAYNTGNFTSSLKSIKKSLYIAGQASGVDYIPDYQNSFISKIDDNGHLVVQKRFRTGARDNGKLNSTNDNALLLYGNYADTQNHGACYFAKIDTNLVTKWIFSLSTSVAPFYESYLSMNDAVQSPANDYFLLCSDARMVYDDKMILLVKADPNGGFIWSKIYRPNWTGLSNITTPYKMVYDNGSIYIMACNGFNDYDATFIIKIDAATGNMIWNKRYINADNSIYPEFLYINNNQLLISGTYKQGVDYNNVLFKLDTDGNLLNSTSFSIPSANVSPYATVLQQPDGTIYLSNSYFASYPNSNRMDFNMKLAADFSILSARQRPSANIKSATALAIGDDGLLYESGSENTTYFDPYYNYFPYLIKYSAQGDIGICPSDTLITQFMPVPIITSSNYFTQKDTTLTFTIPSNFTEQQYLAEDRQICASVNGCNSVNITGVNSICNLQDVYTFVAQKNAGCSAPVQWIVDQTKVQIIFSSDSLIQLKFLLPGDCSIKATIFGGCNPYSSTKNIHVFMQPPLLDLGADRTLCANSSFVLNAHRGFKTYLWQDGSTDTLFHITAPGQYHVIVTDSCNNIFKDTVNISYNSLAPVLNLGNDRFFCNDASFVLNAHRGFISYLWQDGSVDSVFTVTAPGIYYVTVKDDCNNTIRDSISVSAYRKATDLYLGVDTTLCNGASVVLNAHRGFVTYLWQDGSADTMLVASAAGRYWVRVTDQCNNVYTDTLVILPDAYQQFSFGPDRLKCNNDTLTLQVDAGFNNYTYGATTNEFHYISPTVIKVFPSSDATFYAFAFKQNGCLLIDTIKVTVKRSSPIDLGTATRFCINDSLRLNAGNNFAQYLWSTGETTASIYVRTPGQYFITGTDANLCRSRDTITIQSPYALPVIGLQRDSILCSGQAKTLNAGTGFSSYTWSNGTHQQTLGITTPGKYWVTVIYGNGCKATDTVRVNTLRTPPSDFLSFSDSAICSYDTIRLRTITGFQSYLWSTGSTLPSIVIGNAGLYWLKVTDKAGCIGSDSVHIKSKGCIQNIYFPNTFTPNRDRRNDIYAPVVFGYPGQYHFVIYNRGGQKIFETYDFKKGWDGSYLGVAQEQGGYVWMATYQFAGGKLESRNGTLLLLR